MSIQYNKHTSFLPIDKSKANQIYNWYRYGVTICVLVITYDENLIFFFFRIFGGKNENFQLFLSDFEDYTYIFNI